MTKLRCLILGFLLLLIAAPSYAEDAPIKDFFGVFEGETTFLTATGAKKRGMSVSISPVPNALADGEGASIAGVAVSWTTLTKRADGSFKSKTHDAVFVPADREETIFVAVESSGDTDDIGNSDDVQDQKEAAAETEPEIPTPLFPRDPRGTAPYLWGRIKEKTFSIFIVVVAEDGGYEIQIYDRTLTDEGMTLVYSRDRAGEHLKLLEAFLTRKEG
ncbi:hypothetical protein [Pelagibius sp. Alg239-R121]|uniref:hypothetical protein n=1 Tax=Pelagibius sp. Alg239-R121 TaxID=2993448 RepID=UPI0024A75326|nr:hypothetical protein [Pelagibius sp. Alg239-R121]